MYLQSYKHQHLWRSNKKTPNAEMRQRKGQVIKIYLNTHTNFCTCIQGVKPMTGRKKKNLWNARTNSRTCVLSEKTKKKTAAAVTPAAAVAVDIAGDVAAVTAAVVGAVTAAAIVVAAAAAVVVAAAAAVVVAAAAAIVVAAAAAAVVAATDAVVVAAAATVPDVQSSWWDRGCDIENRWEGVEAIVSVTCGFYQRALDTKEKKEKKKIRTHVQLVCTCVHRSTARGS
jgi:hypothetical protein